MNKKKIFFIGIGGIGMSGLAIVAQKIGFEVEGSDIAENYITQRLKEHGIKVYSGHNPHDIKPDTDLIVVSSAIKDDNPQIIKAKRLKIKIMKRAEFLASISENKKLIAVAGCHGKTTTTGMITSVFDKSKISYTAIIGGILKHINTNALYSTGDYFIIEADESDGSFLLYSPLVSCITNIDSDHLDYYGNINSIKEAFIRFINKTPYYGRAVICGDDLNIKSIIKFITAPIYTCGFGKENIWSVKNLTSKDRYLLFDIYYKNKKDANVKLSVFGRHNVINASIAYAASRYLGIDKKTVLEGLENFKGMKRRLELVKQINDIYFYDDYAHHPSEIKATLSAIKSFHKNYNIIALFQPHRYSRTYLLIDEFKKSFTDADEVFISDIYPAGEKNIYGISKEKVLKKISENHKNVSVFSDSLSIAKKLKPKTVVVSLGAGDIYKTLIDISLKYESLVNAT